MDNSNTITKDYKIKSILGSGAIGTAFGLEAPHENYVLKFQATEGTFGTEFLKNL